jgi:hypothetical protein
VSHENEHEQLRENEHEQVWGIFVLPCGSTLSGGKLYSYQCKVWQISEVNVIEGKS